MAVPFLALPMVKGAIGGIGGFAIFDGVTDLFSGNSKLDSLVMLIAVLGAVGFGYKIFIEED